MSSRRQLVRLDTGHPHAERLVALPKIAIAQTWPASWTSFLWRRRRWWRLAEKKGYFFRRLKRQTNKQTNKASTTSERFGEFCVAGHWHWTLSLCQVSLWWDLTLYVWCLVPERLACWLAGWLASLPAAWGAWGKTLPRYGGAKEKFCIWRRRSWRHLLAAHHERPRLYHDKHTEPFGGYNNMALAPSSGRNSQQLLSVWGGDHFACFYLCNPVCPTANQHKHRERHYKCLPGAAPFDLLISDQKRVPLPQPSNYSNEQWQWRRSLMQALRWIAFMHCSKRKIVLLNLRNQLDLIMHRLSFIRQLWRRLKGYMLQVSV